MSAASSMDDEGEKDRKTRGMMGRQLNKGKRTEGKAEVPSKGRRPWSEEYCQLHPQTASSSPLSLGFFYSVLKS
jgi:hypothetical protein